MFRQEAVKLLNTSKKIYSSVNKRRMLSVASINLDAYHCLYKFKDNKFLYHHFKMIRCVHKGLITSDNIVTSPNRDVNIPDCLLHELVWKNIDRWPDKVAIECTVTKRQYTFAQLRKFSRTFAASLLKSGIKPRQIMLVALPNCLEYPIVLLGGSEAGIIVSADNPDSTTDEFYTRLSNSKSVCIVTNMSRLNTINEAISKYKQNSKDSVDVKVILWTEQGEECPSGVLSLREMFENDIDTSIIETLCHTKPDDTVLLPYSSGTTGLVKGVCLTHRNLVSSMEILSTKGAAINMETHGTFQDIVLPVSSLFHIYGSVVVISQAIKYGGKILVLPKFDRFHLLNAFRENKITVLNGLPSTILLFGSDPDVNEDTFQHLRVFFFGSAPIGEYDIVNCMKKFPKETIFKQGYGCTETSPLVTVCPDDNELFQSVGPPLPLTWMKVQDLITGENLKVGEHGEICCFGPQVMKGYLNNPEATAMAIDKDGWFHTGDIGYYDENGYFYIVDRIKEMIKVDGRQVAPAELEQIIRTHPKVFEVAVIGVPDKCLGETPVAYVVLKPGSVSVTSEEIINHVAKKVIKYKIISKVIFTDTLPKNAMGKILRRVLRDGHIS